MRFVALSAATILGCMLRGALLPAPPAQAQMQPRCGMAMQGAGEPTPPEKLPPPFAMTGVGNVHLAISSRNPEAQRWFEQGLNLFFDFWDYESARAFEQAVRADPKCAMCYWGLYQAETFHGKENKGYAQAALDRAKALQANVPMKEKLYIRAADQQASAKTEAGDGDEPDTTAEAATWRRILQKFPRDAVAPLMLSEVVSDDYEPDGTPRKGQVEALRLIQNVLRKEPDNSAANHLWIHAVETGKHPEEALRSAEMLGRLAPASGHMVHMPGHIFYLTGDYARAQAAFAAAMAVDEHYMQVQHVAVDDDWNYVHNLMYAVANLLEQGKVRAATELSGKLAGARGQRPATLYTGSARDSIARIDAQLPVAMRIGNYGQAADLIKANMPPSSLPNLQFLAQALLDFCTGMHNLENAEGAAAQDASKRLDSALWRMSQEVKDAEAADQADQENGSWETPEISEDAEPKPLLAVLSIMSLELRGGIQFRNGGSQEGQKLFAAAQREETALDYREPPSFIRPVGETEAALLLDARDLDQARAAYQRALKERPNSGFPLYGLALVDEAAGKDGAAVTAYRRFLQAWPEADPALEQVTHARAYLAGHDRATAARYEDRLTSRGDGSDRIPR